MIKKYDAKLGPSVENLFSSTAFFGLRQRLASYQLRQSLNDPHVDRAL